MHQVPGPANLSRDGVFEATVVTTGWLAVPDPAGQAFRMPKPHIRMRAMARCNQGATIIANLETKSDVADKSLSFHP